jgi:hypothetical protein
MDIPPGKLKVKSTFPTSPASSSDTVDVPPGPKLKFSFEEDRLLTGLVAQYGAGNWPLISSCMVARNPRQCRERWVYYLNPQLQQGNWTPEEDTLLETKFREYGTKWKAIARFFVNRSAMSLRNRHDMIVRRLKKISQKSQATIGPRSEEKSEEIDWSWPMFSKEEIRVLLKSDFE